MCLNGSVFLYNSVPSGIRNIDYKWFAFTVLLSVKLIKYGEFFLYL